jgi:hypothetical protein
MEVKTVKKTCGNCFTIQPHSETHVVCLNDECKSCGCLKSVNSAGCKKWTAGGAS